MSTLLVAILLARCASFESRDSHLSFAVLRVRFGCCVGRVLQTIENLSFYQVLRAFFFCKNEGNFPFSAIFARNLARGAK